MGPFEGRVGVLRGPFGDLFGGPCEDLLGTSMRAYIEPLMTTYLGEAIFLIFANFDFLKKKVEF